MIVGKSMWYGCVLFTLAIVVTGCGSKAGDKLMKEKVEVLNSMAAEFEKVTNKASMEKALSETKALGNKLDQIEKDLVALPPEAREAAIVAHKDELEKATARFAAAKEQARKKAK